MKILFTNPTLHYSHGHKFIQPDWPSLTLPYMASIAGDNEVHVVDNSFNKDYSKLKDAIRQFKPDIVSFSIIAGRDVPSVADAIRDIKCTVIAGGQGAVYNKDKLKSVTVFEDEGEMALPHFINTGVVKSFERIDLDDSPIPRWDIVDKVKSRTFNTYTGSIEMSRGCPFKCQFCAIASFWHSFRAKSNDRIIDELKYLDSTGRKHIYLADDSFGINSPKHIELFNRIIKNKIGIKFFTQIRADIVAKDKDMINLAKKAGLYGVLVGFDSYDQDVLDKNNKSSSIEINNTAAKVLRENSIAIFGSHIYGLPGQKSFEKTFRLGRKNSDIFAMPYFDGRPKIERPGYDDKYAAYVRKNQFSLPEIFGVIHPNKVIRELKRGGFRKYFISSRGYLKEENEKKRYR